MENWPAVYGALLALAIAFLRITYTGGRGRRRLIESLLCGLITLAAATGIHLIGIPQEATPFLGGMVGLIGVETIRGLAERWLNTKLPKE
ncbi:Phage holin family (Lysis protein S) [compost metagenome]